MHNLAALARRFEEKRAAERSATDPAASPSPDRRPQGEPARGDEEPAVHGDTSVSPRNWSVPTNRYSDTASHRRPSSRLSSAGRHLKERAARRVLVVPLEPADAPDAHGAGEPASARADHAPVPTELSSTAKAFPPPPAPAPAPAPPPAPHPPPPHPAATCTRAPQPRWSQERERSPMPSLAWVPAAPLYVSPLPLSLATDEDRGGAEIVVDLSASSDSAPSSDRTRARADAVPTDADMPASAAPVLIDFYVERDDAPLPGPAPAVASTSTNTSTSTTTAALLTRRDAQAHYEAVRLSAHGLLAPQPPSAVSGAVDACERALFRRFLDDVTGTDTATVRTSASLHACTPAVDTPRDVSRYSGLHESAIAQVDQLQWELVEELCCAVRPFAKVLLLRLMMAAEAGPSAAATPHTASLSKVPLRCCTETINALLAQHGVEGLRATQLLCQKVADYVLETADQQESAAAVAHCEPVAPAEGDGLVEYATFVSHILEIAYAADPASV